MLAFSILSCPGTAIFFTHNLGKLINYWLHSVETTQLQLYRDWYTHFSAKGDCKVQCLLPMLFVGKTNIIPTHKLLTHTSVLTWGSAPHSNRTFTNASKPFRDATWLKWWMSLGEGGREGLYHEDSIAFFVSPVYICSSLHQHTCYSRISTQCSYLMNKWHHITLARVPSNKEHYSPDTYPVSLRGTIQTGWMRPHHPPASNEGPIMLHKLLHTLTGTSSVFSIKLTMSMLPPSTA